MEGEEAVQLARRGGQELAVGREHLGALLDRPERRAADDRADLVQPEEERRDDAEVAAAAADRPEEVGVLVGARAHALAAREHDLRLEQVVDREPALAGQVAEAAAEREAADAGGRDDPARRREPVLVRSRASTSPQVQPPPTRTVRAFGSTSIVLQRREVDDDAVVARCRGRRRCGRRRGPRAAGRARGRTRSTLATSSGLGAAARSAPAAGRSSRCRPCAPRRSRRPRGRSAVRSKPVSSWRAACAGVVIGAHAVLLVGSLDVRLERYGAPRRAVMTRADPLLAPPSGAAARRE